MHHLMQSLDTEALRLELESQGFNTARSSTDIDALRPEVYEAKSMLSSLEYSYK
jgi:hypothetical protein